MALELYNDDNWSVLIVTTPPIRDISESFDINRQATYNFNLQSKDIWQRIARFIEFRNVTQTNTTGTNINGKTTGDYTCAVKDTESGEKFFAKLTMDTQTARFWKNGQWQSDGRSFSITCQRVDVR